MFPVSNITSPTYLKLVGYLFLLGKRIAALFLIFRLSPLFFRTSKQASHLMDHQHAVKDTTKIPVKLVYFRLDEMLVHKLQMWIGGRELV